MALFGCNCKNKKSDVSEEGVTYDFVQALEIMRKGIWMRPLDSGRIYRYVGDRMLSYHLLWDIFDSVDGFRYGYEERWAISEKQPRAPEKKEEPKLYSFEEALEKMKQGIWMKCSHNYSGTLIQVINNNRLLMRCPAGRTLETDRYLFNEIEKKATWTISEEQPKLPQKKKEGSEPPKKEESKAEFFDWKTAKQLMMAGHVCINTGIIEIDYRIKNNRLEYFEKMHGKNKWEPSMYGTLTGPISALWRLEVQNPSEEKREKTIQYFDYSDDYAEMFKMASLALSSAFPWKDSQEGEHYWKMIEALLWRLGNKRIERNE